MTSLVKLSQDVVELDEGLKLLRMAYEKYFAGVERLEPIKERAEVKKQLQRLLSDNSKNTARRFRLQTLQATLITYEQYWNRITRQIEDGTFKRDRLRAERMLARDSEATTEGQQRSPAETEPDPGTATAQASPAATSQASPGATAQASRHATVGVTPGTAADPDAQWQPLVTSARTPPNVPSTAAAASPPPLPIRTPRAPAPTTPAAKSVLKATPPAVAANPPRTASPTSPQPSTTATKAATASSSTSPVERTGAAGKRPETVRQLHDDYVKARKSLGEHEPVSIEAFTTTLQRQETAIRTRLKCNEVEFKVAVKDGKVILKATPR